MVGPPGGIPPQTVSDSTLGIQWGKGRAQMRMGQEMARSSQQASVSFKCPQSATAEADQLFLSQSSCPVTDGRGLSALPGPVPLAEVRQ